MYALMILFQLISFLYSFLFTASCFQLLLWLFFPNCFSKGLGGEEALGFFAFLFFFTCFLYNFYFWIILGVFFVAYLFLGFFEVDIICKLVNFLKYNIIFFYFVELFVYIFVVFELFLLVIHFLCFILLLFFWSLFRL